MKKLSKQQLNKLDFYILIFIIGICFFFWNSYLVYPFKIFVILIHESSHALSTILTGGQVKSLNINWNLSGSSVSNGGIPFVIAFSGYTGSIITGYLLFKCSTNIKLAKWVGTSISVTLILFVSNLMNDAAGIIFALIFAVLLFVIPRYFDSRVNKYFFQIFGLVSTLYAIVDIKQDLLTKSFIQTDAKLLELSSGVPSLVWGLLWFSISCLVLYILLKDFYLNAYPAKRKKSKRK